MGSVSERLERLRERVSDRPAHKRYLADLEAAAGTVDVHDDQALYAAWENVNTSGVSYRVQELLQEELHDCLIPSPGNVVNTESYDWYRVKQARAAAKRQHASNSLESLLRFRGRS